VDFDRNRVYYFQNEKLQGYLSPSKSPLIHGTVYPCVALSVGSKVKLINNEHPTLETDEYWKRNSDIKCTKWAWGKSLDKKSAYVAISNDNVTAKRIFGGTNPAAMADTPLTKNANFFIIQVLKLGTWIGIGVADTQFKLEASHVLGSQKDGLNSSYFFQGAIRKLQMGGEREIRDGVLPIAEKDYIGVEVDFDMNTIRYYNNDILQGIMFSSKYPLQDKKLFACVGMSVGTEVAFVNEIPETLRAKT